MRFLIDTHVFLWAIDEHHRLSNRARLVMKSADNDLLLSTVSLWEILLKAARGKVLGKLTERRRVEFLKENMARFAVTALPVQPSHVFGTSQLPLRHRDPFDRLLIAQARVEETPIITSDAVFHEYPVEVLW